MRTHGTIRKWNDQRGFGFIESATGGDEVFVHISMFPRGVRPFVGDTVSFEIVVDRAGRRRATSIQVPDARRARAVPARATEQRRSGWPSLAIAVALVGIGFAAYPRLRPMIERHMPAAEDAPEIEHTSGRQATARIGHVDDATPAISSHTFSCDDRVHCSQMSSCAEAKYFIDHCPGTKMDGDHDGNPCEEQCGH